MFSNEEILDYINQTTDSLPVCFRWEAPGPDPRHKGYPTWVNLVDIESAPEGYGRFFVPNGSVHVKTTERVQALFVDIDADGSLPKGFSLDDVRRWKREVWDRIDSFPVPATYETDTRNGIQLLWAIEPTTDIDMWKVTIEHLIAHFNADESCKNVNRHLRLPNSTWYKMGMGQQEYRITCKRFRRVRYALSEFSFLRDLVGTVSMNSGASASSFSEADDDSQEGTDSPGTARRDGRSSRRFDRWSVPQRGALRQSMIKDHIRAERASLPEFERVKCPVHHDERPSASLLRDGSMKCHKCNGPKRVFSPFEVYAAENLCSNVEAVYHLAEKYGISVPDIPNGQLLSSVQRISRNLEALPDLVELVAPRIDRMFHGDVAAQMLSVLTYLHSLITDKFDLDQVVDRDGNPAIFASVRHLQYRTGLNKNKVHMLLQAASLFGFIRPVPYREIPLSVRRSMQTLKDHFGKDKSGEAVRTHFRSVTAYYALPEYASDEWKGRFDQTLDVASGVKMVRDIMCFDAIAAIFGESHASWIWPEGDAEWHQRAEGDREAIADIIFNILNDVDAVPVDEIIRRLAQRFRIPEKRARKEFRVHARVLPVIYPDVEIRSLRKAERNSPDFRFVHSSGQYVVKKDR